ncbi:MAG: hypothetical protein JWN87_2835 [Frankiales bacterium]|jgi:hypothetical protein|nr:hypothetical protein [Frankiales bacterium]
MAIRFDWGDGSTGTIPGRSCAPGDATGSRDLRSTHRYGAAGRFTVSATATFSSCNGDGESFTIPTTLDLVVGATAGTPA